MAAAVAGRHVAVVGGRQTGATVHSQHVENFDQLSQEDATNIIYQQIVPACEAKRVMLSAYGNHAGSGSLCSVEEYHESKAGHKLFDVQRIQQAYASIHLIVRDVSEFKAGSYPLKHAVENHASQKAYGSISNGDLIVAMMLKGYDARFGRKNELMRVNCQFKVVEKTVP